jgi:hypothetical protein
MKTVFFMLIIFAGGKILAQNRGSETIRPLIVIDTQFTYNELMIFHPSKFVSISTINPVKAVQIYGENGKFGVIRIQTKPDIRFVRLKDILDKFNVEGKYRNLKVGIDKTLITEPEKLLADIDEIKNVEITLERKSQHTNEAASGEFYINIITRKGD